MPDILSLDKLPHEILIQIFSHLDVKDLINLSLVNQTTKQINEERSLWETLLKRDFPPKIYEQYQSTQAPLLEDIDNETDETKKKQQREIFLQDPQYHPKFWYIRAYKAFYHDLNTLDPNDQTSWKLLLLIDFPGLFPRETTLETNFQKLYHDALTLLKVIAPDYRWQTILLIHRNDVTKLKKLLNELKEENAFLTFQVETVGPQFEELGFIFNSNKTYLEFVLKYGYLETVKLFIELFNKPPKALYFAIEHGRLDITKLLIEEFGYDLNFLFSEDFYQTPLTLAICSNQDAIATYLITNGADVNSKSRFGIALDCALERVNVNLVKLLLKYGAKLTDTSMQKAIRIPDSSAPPSFRKEVEEMISLLINKGGIFELSLENLYNLVHGGLIQALRHFFSMIKDQNILMQLREADSQSNNSVIHGAFKNNDLACLKLLLEKGFSPNANFYGIPTLYYFFGDINDEQYISAAELLIFFNADINKRFSNGETLLFHTIAQKSFSKKLVTLLLAYGIDSTIENNDGETIFTKTYEFDVAERLAFVREILAIKKHWEEATASLTEYVSTAKRIFQRIKTVLETYAVPTPKTAFQFENFLPKESQITKKFQQSIKKWEDCLGDDNFMEIVKNDLQSLYKGYSTMAFSQLYFIMCKLHITSQPLEIENLKSAAVSALTSLPKIKIRANYTPTYL